MSKAVTIECCRTKAKDMKPKRQAPGLAADLVKFINVHGVNKHERKETEVAKQKRKQPVQLTPLVVKEEPVDVENLLLVHGRVKLGSVELENQERPQWTATSYDMAKDLINRRVFMARDVMSVPAETKQEKRSSLSRLMSSLPFHTLLVKWRLSYNFPVYTPRIVYGILSRFGGIESMGSLSPNSAFVVFKHPYQASRAMMSRVIGFNYCPLICRWWYLERYTFPMSDPSEVKREDLLLSDGRLERNSKRHIAQIKREFWRKAAALSYDVSTFRP